MPAIAQPQPSAMCAESNGTMRIPILTTLSLNLAQLGWLDCCCYGVDRLLRPLGWRFHKYHFVAQPIAAAPRSRGRGASVVVRLGTQARDVPPEHPRSRHVIAQRFAQGAHTLQAWRRNDASDDELVGFLWFLPHAYQEDEVRVRYRLASARSVWDFDVYVDPGHRLGPTFLRLWDEANALLRARGVDWTCSRISAYNPGSRAVHGRFGTVTLGSAVFLCCGRWQWMLANRAPYLHLSRGPAAFPTMLFDTSSLAGSAALEPSCPVSTK